MWFLKLFLAACLMILTLAPQFSLAQNSPQDFVNAHNAVRAEVGVGPLVWNDTVASYAQKFAKKRSGDCNFENSYGPYGENLAVGDGLTGVDAVKMWASEKSDYDHASNTCKSGGDDCLHYTQVVARKSVQLGCGRAKCKNGPGVFVVCSYDPIGNIEGQLPY
ncbi:hypothetical protein REPUB_Repub04eG0020200 [Reevesia pubescens]